MVFQAPSKFVEKFSRRKKETPEYPSWKDRTFRAPERPLERLGEISVYIYLIGMRPKMTMIFD